MSKGKFNADKDRAGQTRELGLIERTFLAKVRKQNAESDTNGEEKRSRRYVEARAKSPWNRWKQEAAKQSLARAKSILRSNSLRNALTAQARYSGRSHPNDDENKPRTPMKLCAEQLKLPTSKWYSNLQNEDEKLSQKLQAKLMVAAAARSKNKVLLVKALQANNIEDFYAGEEDIFQLPEYVKNIYEYLTELEYAQPILSNLLEHQKEITPEKRAVLMDWVNAVHTEYYLTVDTYHMSVSIIDRYLQRTKNIPISKFQLVGVAAMLIAAKYDGMFPPSVEDFAYITDGAYNTKQVIKMEMDIFKTLDYNLSRPIPTQFLRRFAKVGKAGERPFMAAKYLLELASIEFELAAYNPSELAAAALLLSLHLFNEDANATSGFKPAVWTDTLESCSHYTGAHLLPLVQKIAKLARNASRATLKNVYDKYEHLQYLRIAQRPEFCGALIDSIIVHVPQ